MEKHNEYTQIENTKRMLIERYSMTEARAERYINKIAINAGVTQAQAAQMIKETLTCDTPTVYGP